MYFYRDVFCPIEVNRSYQFYFPDFSQPGISYPIRLWVSQVRQWHGDWLIGGRTVGAASHNRACLEEAKGGAL